jgi:lysophospholipid acyltransferase (LPLAT)-like uncharacterized protein
VKVRHPLLLRVAGFFAALLLRLWLGTLRFRARALGTPVLPRPRRLGPPRLFAFWHEFALLPAVHYRGVGLAMLISQHADGELIATACRHLGHGVVRGSTTRGGAGALREMVRATRRGHTAITPDGPRGPRRRLQVGLVYLAARTGLPVVPVGFACRRAWRLRSWDRLVLPYPFTEVWCVSGEPVVVPPDADRTRIEAYRRRIEAAMAEATAAAERLAGAVPAEDTRAENAAAA